MFHSFPYFRINSRACNTKSRSNPNYIPGSVFTYPGLKIYSYSKRQTLDSPKMEEFAGNNLKFDEKIF